MKTKEEKLIKIMLELQKTMEEIIVTGRDLLVRVRELEKSSSLTEGKCDSHILKDWCINCSSWQLNGWCKNHQEPISRCIKCKSFI